VAWVDQRRAFRAVCAAGCFAALPVTGFAAPGSARVQVAVTGCSEHLEPAKLSDAFAVELKNLDAELVAYIENTNPRVSISCRPRGDTSDIVVRVETDRGVALEETLEATEAGATRFIAIAVAESLHAQASSAPPPTPPKPEPPPEAEPAPPAPPAKAPTTAARFPEWWARGALGTRLFGDPGIPSLSGRIGGERVSSPDWLVAADVEGSYGEVNVSSGHLRAVTGSLALALHHRFQTGRFALLPGLGARAGVLRWKGRPDNRETTRGLSGYAAWAGPFADLRFALGITRATRVDFDVEGGFTPTQVKATENSNVIGSIGELWLSLQLGVAFQP
jgi:hypothetical protein